MSTKPAEQGPVAWLIPTLIALLTVAGLYLARPTLQPRLRGIDPNVFGYVVKSIALLVLVAYFWMRARISVAGTSSRRLAILGGAAFVAVIVAVFVTTPQINFGPGKLGLGYGHDGINYGDMTDNFAWFTVVAEPPFSYRFLAPMLVHYSGLNTFVGYTFLAVTSYLASGVLICLIGRELRAPAHLRVAVLLLAAMTKFGLKLWIYYPVLTDGLGNLLLLLAIYAVLTRRHLVFAIVLAIGITCRENLIILVLFHVVYVLRVPELRQRWFRYCRTDVIPIGAYFLTRIVPVFIPKYHLDPFRLMVFNLRQFLVLPDHQYVLAVAELNSLGVLAVVPILFWRDFIAFLRGQLEWLTYCLSTVAISILGGFDFDRFALWQVPTIVVFIFKSSANTELWRSIRWVIALVTIQIVASEVPLPWDTDTDFYLSRYAVYSGGTDAFAAITIFGALLIAALFALKWRLAESSAFHAGDVPVAQHFGNEPTVAERGPEQPV